VVCRGYSDRENCYSDLWYAEGIPIEKTRGRIETIAAERSHLGREGLLLPPLHSGFFSIEEKEERGHDVYRQNWNRLVLCKDHLTDDDHLDSTMFVATWGGINGRLISTPF
jgi:hypothetical protein